MNQKIQNVKVSSHQLPKWNGEPTPDTYGGKPLLEKDGQPVFAEIYALWEYEEQGYRGVWVDNYRKRGVSDMSLANVIDQIADSKLAILKEINGQVFRSGTWDLLLWKEEEVKFVELKRVGKDQISDSQLDFYARALGKGYRPEQFEIFEWDLV